MSANNKILDNIPASLIVVFIFFSGITYFQGYQNSDDIKELETKVKTELVDAAAKLQVEIKELEKLRLDIDTRLFDDGKDRDVGIADLNEKVGRVEERLKNVEKWCRELIQELRRAKNEPKQTE